MNTKNLTIITLGIGLVLITFIRDKITFFIHPRYETFTLTMSIIGATIILAYLFQNRKLIISKLKQFSYYKELFTLLMFIFIILLFPFLFLLIIPAIIFFKSKDNPLLKLLDIKVGIFTIFVISILTVSTIKEPLPLSSQSFNNRNINSNAVLNNSIADNFEKKTTDYSVKDWNLALQYSSIESFKGSKFSLTGFVSKPIFVDNPNIFMVSRFTISCCAVDASPIGVLFENNNLDTLELDEWIKIEGTMDSTTINNQKYLIARPQLIEKIQIPDEPYIF